MARRDVRHKLTVWRNDTKRFSKSLGLWIGHGGVRSPASQGSTSSPPRRPLPTLITFAAMLSPISCKTLLHTVTSAVWECLFPDHSPGLFFLSHHLTLSPMPISPKWKNTYTFLEDVLFICNPLGRQYSGSPIMISEHLLTEQHDGMNSSWQ